MLERCSLTDYIHRFIPSTHFLMADSSRIMHLDKKLISIQTGLWRMRTVIHWLPQSIDLNPIEHPWDVVEREICIIHVRPTIVLQPCCYNVKMAQNVECLVEGCWKYAMKKVLRWSVNLYTHTHMHMHYLSCLWSCVHYKYYPADTTMPVYRIYSSSLHSAHHFRGLSSSFHSSSLLEIGWFEITFTQHLCAKCFSVYLYIYIQYIPRSSPGNNILSFIYCFLIVI